MLPESALLRDAMNVITRTGSFMACINNECQCLIGILTDSDIRRALLRGATVDDSVLSWMNRNPIVAADDMDVEGLLALAKAKGIREIPLLNKAGQLEDIFILLVRDQRQLVDKNKIEPTQGAAKLIPNPMLILAGGIGSRLRSVVNDRPKPLAIVGNKPILETVIHRAASFGFRKFYISVNYLADQIKEHLNSPCYRHLDIRIVEESKKLGTAGAIGFIQDEVEYPLVVCNADVLTTVPYHHLVNNHLDEKADVTCTVRPYRSVVPYGVCNISDGQITSIVEKPETNLMVNAGIYVLSPQVCNLVEKDSYLDMPQLVSEAIKLGFTIRPFFLHEYWIDIGRPEDFSKANDEFERHFGFSAANPTTNREIDK